MVVTTSAWSSEETVEPGMDFIDNTSKKGERFRKETTDGNISSMFEEKRTYTIKKHLVQITQHSTENHPSPDAGV